jgi:ParB family chromosome partitioning protein
MAKEVERLVAGTDWLPELLRTPGVEGNLPASADPAALPAFLTTAETAGSLT